MRSFVDDLPAQLKSDIIRISEESDGAFKVFQELYEHLTTDNKRRKTVKDESETPIPTATLDNIIPSTVILQLRELSFLSPLRKKLNLTISISPVTQKPVFSIGKTNDDKPELVISDLSKNNITFATFLPVPEKKNQLYICIFYNKNSQSNNIQGTDPIVCGINTDTVAKQLVSDKAMKENDNLLTYLVRQSAVAGLKITDSFTPSSQSFFVTAFRGTKEGTLYFLPTHIVFGFKKPILMFTAQDIASISYNSITRMTFNVTVVLHSGEKIEFSMIDQDEFGKIDDYIKNREVEDMSMSEENKAKPMGKNAATAGALAEATQQLVEGPVHDEDDDDEDDGDYQVTKETDDTSDASDDDEDSDSQDNELEGDEDDDSEDDDDEDGDAVDGSDDEDGEIHLGEDELVDLEDE